MTEVQHFLNFLGSRYAKARTELDEVRIRAMEIVLAACVTELRETPPVFQARTTDDVLASYADDDDDDHEFRPPPDLEATSELDVESYLKEELEWLQDPTPRRAAASEPPPTSEVDLPPEPDLVIEQTPVPEAEAAGEHLTDATNWSSGSPVDEERAAEEPVRGAWQAPES